MMMTSKSLFLTASLFAVGLFASCSSENTGGDDHGKEKEIGHLTVFSTEDEAVSAKPGMTRTTGIYNGTKINFFWTQNDKLWIKDGANLIKNAEDNITGVQARLSFIIVRL